MAENLDPSVLAKHLRKPEGKIGIEVAENMNVGNRGICLNTYGLLELKAHDHVLEIGMGNGRFVSDLFDKEPNIYYTGIDYSSTMVHEASAINQELVLANKVDFIEASVSKLPLNDHSIDHITTTNTIYFWPQAQEDVSELFRVLKSKGKLVIGYRDKTFLSSLKVTKHGFTKYTQNEVETLLIKTGFKNVHTKIIQEDTIIYEGQEITLEGVFTIGEKE